MRALKYSTAALAMLIASGMAYAEDSTTTTQSGTAAQSDTSTQSGTTAQSGGTAADCPAAGTVAEADLTAECKTMSTTQAPKAESDALTTGTTEVQKTDTDTSGTTTTTTDTMATTEPGANLVPANMVLASQFMGQAVYSAANENVGEINDLVLDRKLDTVTAVIGVGGFLGIGEKDVAIPIDQIKAAKDENNNLRLTIDSSKEQLEAAPAFDRTAQN